MSTAAPAQTSFDRAGRWPAFLCWMAVALEGFDLVVLGAVIPDLLETGVLGFTPQAATLAATLSLVGVGAGAAGIGPVVDRIGRRWSIIICVFFFSLFTLLVAFAPTLFLFITFRLIAGVFLGAVMPCCLAYIGEYTSTENTAKATTLTMTGYHAGAVAISLLAVYYSHNWHLLFTAGAVAGFLMVPLLLWKLPESQAFLNARDSKRSPLADTDAGVEAAGLKDIFKGRLALVTIGVWAASFMGLLLVYGLNTWLPKIMADAGYEVSDSLVMLLVLNVGAVIGLAFAGWLADKHGKKVVLMWFVLSAVFLAVLSVPMTSQIVLNAAILITGIFVFSAQVLVYAFVSSVYPPNVRGSAIGMAAGVGRLGAIVGPYITGTLVTLGIAYPWGFYVFALVAVLGFIAMAIVPAQLTGSKDKAAAPTASASLS